MRNLGRAAARHASALERAVRRVLASGHYILGPEVAAFEEEFAAYCKVRDAVGVGSGTDALLLVLRALGSGHGTEVILPAHTAPMTASAVVRSGATPVFCDVDRSTQLIDPAAVERALSPRTSCVIAVHLYGQCANVSAIRKITDARGIPVVEDAAQAAGALRNGVRAGAMGRAATFSFYPTKNLGACGDAGCVVTNDRALAEEVRNLRAYGMRDGRVSHQGAMNSRLDELQAALLREKLLALDETLASRMDLAQRYTKALTCDLELPATLAGNRHTYHLFTARVPERDRFRARMEAAGIETQVHYAPACPNHPAFAEARLGPGGVPESEAAARETVSLPFYPELAEDEVSRVLEATLAALR